MKRILLIVGIAFGCTSVYAQNSIQQSGNNNFFTADQNDKTNPLTVYHVKQFQGYNEIKIRQGFDVFSAGQQNVANLNQISIGVTQLNMRNYMDVFQEGASNRINSDQYGQNNRLKATQTVFTNTSTINTSQSGWNNGIIVLQDGDPAGGTAQFTTTIQQGGAIPGNAYNGANGNVGPLPNTSRNTVMLSQLGVGRGTANITQLGSSGLATVTQRGGDIAQNLMTIYQTNNGGANVQQAGNNNVITVAQQGYQYAKVRQQSANPANQTEPVNSTITILQGVNQLDDTRNSADVSQLTGDGNQATVNQNTNGAERNYATIRQIGTRLGGTPSTVTVNQLGKSSTVEVEQMENSSGNTANFTQGISELFQGSNAKLNQGGNANTYNSAQYGRNNNIGGTIGDMSSFGTQRGISNNTSLTQNGRNNQIALNQAGTTNQILVDQLNDQASTEGNKATATQGTGTSQNIMQIIQNVPDGDNNVAIVNQTKGDLNQALVIQYEDDYASITQSGTDDLGDPSTVIVNQQTAGNAKATVVQADGTKGGDVVIAQAAIGNEATVSQNAGRRNQAQVSQGDDMNKATVTQTGTLDLATPSIVLVNQLGKAGEVTVTQSANGSTTQVDQYGGDRNKSTVTQNGTRRDYVRTEQGGDDNMSTVGQMGDNNIARVLQGGVLGTLDHAMNTASIMQAGTDNDAVTAQGGIGNNASIDQKTGRDNFAVTVQYGTTNIAKTTQSSPGKLNSATVLQLKTNNNPGLSGALGSTNANTVADNIKAASGNYGNGIDQVEDNNATVNQTAGENQVAFVLQTGDNETLTLNQMNTDNNAFVLQAGEFDKATITQRGSFGIGLAAQYGTDGQNGNTLIADQSGSYNAFVAAQGYHNNSITIDQQGSENGLNGSGVLTGGIIAAQYGQRNTINLTQNANMSLIGVAQGNIAPAVPSIDLVDLLGFTQVFDNTATVNQTGRQNIALIGQQGDGTAGLKSEATITQAGQNNLATILQVNVGLTDVFSLPNKAVATQSSTVSESQIIITQQGRRNDADVQQLDGRNQSITLTQTLDENKATLKQLTGNTNVIILNQGTDPGRVGHTATITQSGEVNTALLDQSGYENSLTLTQTGNRNTLQGLGGNPTAQQGGHNNMATLSQTGEDHVINFNQSGMNNMSTIVQTNL
ncbi:beta strand repeat-containing protein [Salmonirosea aquatica]|uniref:Curlin associated repeat-containing protein n=1 Tax=Salmonirosea aquatica TaxID=2654236 RepID=A0A7C9BSZ5_9BACT|nr:hypothetical protein [Cytophagaceae bacterium SJW1-29]